MIALEEIQISPKKIDEIKIKEIDVQKLMSKGYIKEENGFLYITEEGIKRLSELYGLLDTLQRIYIDLSYGNKIKITDFDVKEIEKLKNEGLIEIKNEDIVITFEGIKTVAQRIAEKMARGH
ncbi:hypothetical protein B6F84_04430 [Acidianus manzaensis]|uniref:Uncharacterized protein n=1 Tax=Acidianus manzaensis TaxID=282676 RepID=A0A1W6JYK5_9CREN|nr:hypothetical protein B6F84_04430 [Acidianus manzaensis]